MKPSLFVLAIIAIVGIVNLTTFIDMLLEFKGTFMLSVGVWVVLFGIDKKLVKEFV